MGVTYYGTLFINAVALTLGVLGLISVVVARDMEKWSRIFLIAFVSVTIFNSLVTFGETMLSEYAGTEILTGIANVVEKLCSLSVYNMITLYILHLCGKPIRKNAAVYIVGALSVLTFTMTVIMQINGCLYSLPDSKASKSCPLYFVVLILEIMIFLTNIILILAYRKYLPKKRVVLFILCFVFSAVVQLVLFEIIVLFDQVKQYLEHKKELERQKASLLVMQMRPHFIYNVMTDIYYLIPQDQDKAQQVTMDFTNYLRSNFTAIAKEETIPFTEELSHVQAYLAVEQVRFEDKLSVAFDTPDTNFRLPPLTLQPIVENAVKYGVDPERDSISVRITTRTTEEGNIITVEDTGAGLSDADNGEPHIAIDNVRERLKLFCGGTLTFSAHPEGGTTATIFIPQNPAVRKNRRNKTL